MSIKEVAGYFDFVNDTDVSAALLDAVAQWGHERGMDTIQGPMGITDFDKEGMLLTDFHRMGSMNTLYNFPYYPRHMEAHGYEKEVDWVQVRIDITFDAFIFNLTDKNHPSTDGKGLFLFPEGTYQMGKEPYMEASVGIENIFNAVRIDYVRRLNYLHHPGIQKNGIRATVVLSF